MDMCDSSSHVVDDRAMRAGSWPFDERGGTAKPPNQILECLPEGPAAELPAVGPRLSFHCCSSSVGVWNAARGFPEAQTSRTDTVIRT